MTTRIEAVWRGLMDKIRIDPGDYPSEPIGGGNPYHRCSRCKRSAPEINNRLDGHLPDCSWLKERLLVALTEIIEEGVCPDTMATLKLLSHAISLDAREWIAGRIRPRSFVKTERGGFGWVAQEPGIEDPFRIPVMLMNGNTWKYPFEEVRPVTPEEKKNLSSELKMRVMNYYGIGARMPVRSGFKKASERWDATAPLPTPQNPPP